MAVGSFEATPNFSGACEGCGASFVAYVRPSHRPRRFCSSDCGSRSMAGSKQAAAHVEKRTRRGTAHPRWMGDAAGVRAGRSRALRMYRNIGPCLMCGARQAERHHVDGNTLNNEPGNIRALCRKCHMEEDHRLSALIDARRRAG